MNRGYGVKGLLEERKGSSATKGDVDKIFLDYFFKKGTNLMAEKKQGNQSVECPKSIDFAEKKAPVQLLHRGLS